MGDGVLKPSPNKKVTVVVFRKVKVKIMRRLNRNEVPNTRVEFINKWNSDRIFKARATNMGFNVLFNKVVVFPDGKMADERVR